MGCETIFGRNSSNKVKIELNGIDAKWRFRTLALSAANSMAQIGGFGKVETCTCQISSVKKCCE